MKELIRKHIKKRIKLDGDKICFDFRDVDVFSEYMKDVFDVYIFFLPWLKEYFTLTSKTEIIFHKVRYRTRGDIKHGEFKCTGLDGWMDVIIRKYKYYIEKEWMKLLRNT